MTESRQQDEKSRSQVKREFRELKELGKRLAALSKGELRAIPLSDRARDAVLAAQGMSRSALSRQYRRLSSLLAEEDVPSIRAALASQIQPQAAEITAFHEAEAWRDRLLSGNEEHLAAFVGQYPDCDRRHLRQLIRNARKERDQGKPPRSARELFRQVKLLCDGGN